MKFYLLSALIIVAFLSACKKGGNVAMPEISSQADSVSKAISDSLPVAKYVGTWVDSVTFGGYCGAPGTEYDTNLSFVFCVANIKNNSLIFYMPNPIVLSEIGYSFPIVDTVLKTTQNLYFCNAPYSTIFKIINDSLYVSGNNHVGYGYNGTDGYANFSFAGKLQPDTATVQARQRKP